MKLQKRFVLKVKLLLKNINVFRKDYCFQTRSRHCFCIAYFAQIELKSDKKKYQGNADKFISNQFAKFGLVLRKIKISRKLSLTRFLHPALQLLAHEDIYVDLHTLIIIKDLNLPHLIPINQILLLRYNYNFPDLVCVIKLMECSVMLKTCQFHLKMELFFLSKLTNLFSIIFTAHTHHTYRYT